MFEKDPRRWPNVMLKFLTSFWARLMRRYYGSKTAIPSGDPARVIVLPLSTLTLSASTLTENSPQGTLIGFLVGTSIGSTLALTDNAGGKVQLSGGALQAGAVAADYDTGIFTFTVAVTETLGTASNSPLTTTLTISIINQNDTNPTQFTFTDVTNCALSTVQTSNTITISGMSPYDSANATITGAASSQLQKNGGGWVSGPLVVVNTDTLAVRHTSAATNTTATNTVLTVGTTSDTFTSTTTASGGGTTAGQPTGLLLTLTKAT